MDTNTLYVLDFATAEVHVYVIEADQQIEEVEQFIEDQGHSVSDCQFMYGSAIKLTDHRPEQLGGLFMVAYAGEYCRIHANSRQAGLYQAQQDYQRPPAQRLLDWKDSEHTAEEWDIIKID